MVEKGANCPRIGFDRLGTYFLLLGFIERVVEEFGPLLEGDDELPEVVSVEIFDFLSIRAQEVAEVVDTEVTLLTVLGLLPSAWAQMR
jgi:hypothetical protein